MVWHQKSPSQIRYKFTKKGRGTRSEGKNLAPLIAPNPLAPLQQDLQLELAYRLVAKTQSELEQKGSNFFSSNNS